MFIRKNDNLLIFNLASGAIIYNKATKKSYKLGQEEYDFFNEIDGHKTVEDLSRETNYDVEKTEALLALFDEYSFLASSDIKVNKGVQKKHALVYEAKFLNVFSRPVFKYVFNFLTLISVPMMIFAIIFMHGKINVEPMMKSVNFMHIIAMDIILAFSISLHEIFHAIAAKNNGAFCAEIGYTLDIFIPSAYTTLCGVNEIKSKAKKIQVFGAGISVNAMIAATALLLMNTPMFQNNVLLFLVYSCNLCLILLNSITFAKTDGYHILCTLFNNMNLKESTIKILREKGCLKIENMVYSILTYIVQPVLIIVLLIVALRTTGGKIL